MHRLLARTSALFLRPKTVWKDIEREKGVGAALQYALCMLLIGEIIAVAVLFFLMHLFPGRGPLSVPPPESELTAVTSAFLDIFFIPVILFLGIVVQALFTTLGALMLRIPAPFAALIRISAYAGTADYLLFGVPYLMLAGNIWSLLLFWQGQQTVLHLSRRKNLCLFLVSAVVPLLLSSFMGVALMTYRT